MANDYFASKGKNWYNNYFYNNLHSSNIAIYSFLADTLFEGDLDRVVWASADMVFRRRQEQVSQQNQRNESKANIGTLDIPFCGFRLNQDGISTDDSRRWFNQALNVEGMWIEELGRKVRLTPITLNYEGFFFCQSDTDLYYMTSKALWIQSNETLVKSSLDVEAEDGTRHTVSNIINVNMSLHVNDRYSEQDWLSNNKIQNIRFDLTCNTWLMGDDRHKYWLTKEVVFNFLNGVNLSLDNLEEREMITIVHNFFEEPEEPSEEVPPVEEPEEPKPEEETP